MADVIQVPGEEREDFGKGYARRIRQAGKIPAVIYGHGHDPIHVTLPGHQMMLIARNANAVVEVSAGGEKHLAMLKDVQRDAIRPEIVHIDLLTIARGEKVEVDVPVVLEGEVAPNAMHTQEETVITVSVDALKVPEQFELSIEGLEPGQYLYASDVTLPAGVELISDPELMIVNVSEPQEQDLGELEEEQLSEEELEEVAEEEGAESDADADSASEGESEES